VDTKTLININSITVPTSLKSFVPILLGCCASQFLSVKPEHESKVGNFAPVNNAQFFYAKSLCCHTSLYSPRFTESLRFVYAKFPPFYKKNIIYFHKETCCCVVCPDRREHSQMRARESSRTTFVEILKSTKEGLRWKKLVGRCRIYTSFSQLAYTALASSCRQYIYCACGIKDSMSAK
jgi:hypothetical protein